MLAFLLAICAYFDYRYRKIPDWTSLIIGIYAVFFSRANGIERAAGFIYTAAFLYILALATDKIKGGDIKFLSFCAGALGLTVFSRALFTSSFIALIWSILKKEKSVPLAFVFCLGYAALKLLEFIGG